MPTHLSTNAIALRERPAYWNFLVSSVLGRLHTIPQTNEAFQGEMSFTIFDQLPIAQVASTQLLVKRPQNFIVDSAEDFFKINFQLAGKATLTQRKKRADLIPGDWVIYDNAEPYDLQFHSDYKQLLFLVPRQLLTNRFPTLNLRLATKLEGRSGAGHMLATFARNALTEGHKISADGQSKMASMLLDMLLLGLTDSVEIELPQSTRRLRAEQFIKTQLASPELSPVLIAQGLHISVRTLHSLFHDTTVMRYIWQQRLEQCRKDIVSPTMQTVAIQTIAAAWGFKTTAHFSRLFKQAYGLSASDLRRQIKDLH